MSETSKKSGTATDNDWTMTIRPVSGWFDFHLPELWRYRDLIMLFVRRDFVSVYKQTILGPLWYLLQPIMTTLVFTVIFGMVAQISTDGLPKVLFYLSGLVAWRYFSDCLTKTSDVFLRNANLFGKVYFPRLTVPVSIVISSLITFMIQFGLLLVVWCYYAQQGTALRIQPVVVILPLLIVQMAALGLGCGIIISSLTTKYRDLAQLVAFGAQLWLYATPVVYPTSIIPERWQWLMALNPMAPIIELFRYALLGVGTVDAGSLLVSLVTTLLILAAGIVLFSRIEKSFMDTV